MDQRRSVIFKWAKGLLLILVVLMVILIVLPVPKLKSDFSTVLMAYENVMMGARIADDGQWRFPLPEQIPEQLDVCLRLFEDEYFYYHPGCNPVSIFCAIRQNMAAGKVVSGGSTITMQLARILRGNPKRTVANKMLEMMIAFQLELKYSKSEILNQYAGLAPFGGNVVGVDAASWRYYGRSLNKLSWSETATLAVLPNAPSLIYPGKQKDGLKKKRDRLLFKLFTKGYLEEMDYNLAIEEPLPGLPLQLPSKAPHLLQDALDSGFKGKMVQTTIDPRLQDQHLEIASRFHDINHDNAIHNLAIMSVDISTGEIKSYIGNSDCTNASEGIDVNIINAPRSSGSILKPLLYAAAFDDGLIAPSSLIPDIPTKIANYAPKNFDKSYSGAVSSEDALTRSLNIPAVRLLQDYGVPKFHELLQSLEFSTINSAPNHYGLSLILGGAEVTLFDLVNAYSGLSTHMPSETKSSAVEKISYLSEDKKVEKTTTKPAIDPGAIWKVLKVLSNVERPRGETGWNQFANGRKIAWKTGTSFGHRDAWAIGHDGNHVVGVWVGNADGEGRPGLTGLNYAGPILFEIFGTLAPGHWIPTPYDDLEDIALCASSGYRIGPMCSDTLVSMLPVGMKQLSTCSFHTMLSTDQKGHFQVNRSCHPIDDIIQQSYFTLPPSQAFYYRKHASDYRPIPPLKPGCGMVSSPGLDIIYPFPNADVAIPVDLNGEKQELIFAAAHTNPKATLHWHIDDTFIQSTNGKHEIIFEPAIGEHVLHVVDQDGVEERRRFEVVE